ncbi:MAG: tetratricopeptide repeat protein, partial [Candidatus Limnocylindria bacterium]
DVCRAVQHSHQKGVIHRDLKPSNVMVTRHDDTAVVKVIDFGVSKALSQKLTEKTVYTALGQMIGTPLYMSPEQSQLSDLDVDTRSDVYSLGVLLYELLTGTTPFDKETLQKSGFDEMRRIIREVDPPRPSARVSTLNAALVTTVAEGRRTDPRRLIQAIRGELDWIVMKCLEKDRNRRYETADGLARDTERYLRDEPVEASPPGVGYRLRKFLTRNKGGLTAVVLVLAALLAGTIGTTWGMIRAEGARRDAVAARLAEAQRADGERRARKEVQARLIQIEKRTEILAGVFGDLDPMAAEAAGVALRDLLCRRLVEAAQQLEGEAMGDPLVVARLQHVLGSSVFEMGHREQAEELLSKAARTRERMLGAEHLDTAATQHQLAMLYREQGEYAAAEKLYQHALAVRTSELGAEHLDTAATQHHLAMLYASQRHFTRAEALLTEVLAIRTAKLGADHPDTLTTQHRLATIYRSQANYALSERLLTEVLAIRTAKLGADHLDTVATKDALALLYQNQGRFAPAETLTKEVLAIRTAKLGADHPDTLISRQSLAGLHLR